MNIPDHELVRQVGQGSYGEVWLARNVMGRYRAAKFIFRKTFRDVYPFQRELAGIEQFEPVSRSHPGFVHVLHVGRNDAEGYFYYLMEVADDVCAGQQIDPSKYTPKTLSTEIARAGRLGVAEALELARQLTSALGHLHEKGLVHRDIKPSNIVFVDNAPKFADIGLVTSIDDSRSYVGTEGFIPPEGPGSARADIFSLGKVLYEAATGKDRQQFPELPGDFGNGEEAAQFLELNEIILKACDPDGERSYQSAGEMLAELELIHAGKSVRRARKRTLLMRRTRRLSYAALIAAAVGISVFFPLRQRWAEAAVRQREAVHAELTRADSAVRAGSYLDALPFYVRALRLDASDPLRAETHRLRIGSALGHSPRLMRMWFLSGPARRVEVSHDGRRVLLVDDRIVAIDVETGKTLSAVIAPAGLRDACLSPNGEKILSAAANGDVVTWNLDGSEFLRLPHPGEVCSARFGPDGLRVITASADGIARIWSLENRAVEQTLRGHQGRANHASFSGDGSMAVTTGNDGKALLWDARTGARLGAEMVHPAPVNDAEFSPDGKRLVTACEDGTARLWRAPGGEDTAGVMRHEAPVRTAAFSTDGRVILTASHDLKAHLWQAALGIPARENPALRASGRLTCAGFGADGRRVITASIDGTVRLWDLSQRMLKPSFISNLRDIKEIPAAELGKGGSNRLAGSYFNSERQRVLSVSAQRAFRIWDSLDGEPATALVEYSENIASVFFLPDARSILGIDGESQRGWVWRFETDKHSAEELRFICGLLANDWIDSVADHVEIERAWKQMSAAAPALFSVSGDEIAGWHQAQSRAARAEKNRPAAAFHLRKILEMDSKNESARRELAELEEEARR